MAARKRRVTYRRGLASALAASLVGCALVACVQEDGRRFNPFRQLTEVSLDDEREIGLQFDSEIRKHVQIIDDPIIAGFINDLGQSIVSHIEPQPFLYRFRVVADPSLNAFAVPGGYIYFHSGTILEAGSIDELAGVMGHEIAHVKEHHYARMRAKTQIPDILVGVAGMAAAVATGEGGLLVAAQAANVAAKLSFSREFETEADQYGGVFMTRAGYRPGEIARFFERLIDQKRALPDNIPPYLFSHPDVEHRISTVELQAKSLRVSREQEARFSEELLEVQARLAYLIDAKRQSVPPPDPPTDATRIDPLLSQAEALVAAGDTQAALVSLARAEAIEPTDPRAPFRSGELLASRGRLDEAVAAFQRTLRLDATRGQIFFQLGLAQRLLGKRHSAVQAFEQASRRSGASSALSQRANWHVETLLFPVLTQSGFADESGTASPTGGDPTPYGVLTETIDSGAARLLWVGQINERYDAYAEHLRIEWRNPTGDLIAETKVEPGRKRWISSAISLSADAHSGRWTADLAYQGDPVERSEIDVQSSR